MRRRRLAASVGIAAACVAGGLAGSRAPDAAAGAGGCHVPYLVLDADERFGPREVRRAVMRERYRVHRAVRHLEPPVNWLQDPYNSKAFRSHLARLAWTGVLFQAYRQRERLRPLRLARDLIVDWVRHQPYRGPRTSDQAWHEKEIADRGPFLAYLLRAGTCEGILDAAQRADLRRSIALHGELLTRPAFHPPSNHGLFVDAGLVLLGTQMRGMDGAAYWRALGERRFRRTLFNRLHPREGLWLEQSAGYQFLLIGLVRKFLDIPGISDPRLRRALRRMRRVGGWLVEPDGRIVQIGDTEITRRTAAAAPGSRTEQGLLWLDRSGLAVARRSGTYLAVASAFHNRSHKDSDDLSFDLFARGHRVVSDTGLYEKDPGRYYDYENSSRAHSTLMVDGREFPLSARFAYGSGLRARGRGDGWIALEATNPLVRRAHDVEHDRLFLLDPGAALIVVDRVRASAAHTYQRLFHLGPDLGIGERGGGLALRAGAGFRGSLHSESTRGRERRAEIRGQDRPLQGFTFPRFRVREPRWTIRFRSRG